MKKLPLAPVTLLLITAYLILFLCYLYSYAQEVDTSYFTTSHKFQSVEEVEIENRIAERLETMLSTFIGKSLVLVDMQLQYTPALPEGMTLDREASLPGIPVAKSETVLPRKIGDTTILPTRIHKILITIYVGKKLSQAQQELVKHVVFSWIRLDHSRGDELRLEKMKFISGWSGINDYKTVFLFLISICILAMIVAIFMKKESTKKAKEIFPSEQAPVAPVPTPSTSLPEEKTLLETGTKTPIKVELMRKKDEKTSEERYFELLQQLDDKQLQKLIQDELPETIAVLLFQLPPNLSSRLFTVLSDKLRHAILSETQPIKTISQSSLQHIKEHIEKKLQSVLHPETLEIDVPAKLTEMVKLLNQGLAKDTLENLTKHNRTLAEKIRAEVILFEDVLHLEDRILKNMLPAIDRRLLTIVLSVASEEIKTKFYNNMTERMKAIIEEDVALLDQITPEEIEHAKREIIKLMQQATATRKLTTLATR